MWKLFESWSTELWSEGHLKFIRNLIMSMGCFSTCSQPCNTKDVPQALAWQDTLGSTSTSSFEVILPCSQSMPELEHKIALIPGDLEVISGPIFRWLRNKSSNIATSMLTVCWKRGFLKRTRQQSSLPPVSSRGQDQTLYRL